MRMRAIEITKIKNITKKKLPCMGNIKNDWIAKNFTSQSQFSLDDLQVLWNKVAVLLACMTQFESP